MVWNHQHNDPSEVLGHALLENREDGVYAYCKFNDTESGQTAKSLVHNGDVDKLSIYANKLKTQMNNVMHGCIREVSLVLAGANPGAYIDSIIVHGEGADAEEEGVIYTDEEIEIANESDNKSEENKEENEDTSNDLNNKKEDKVNMDKEKELQHADSDNNEKTVQEVFDTLNNEQKDAVYAIIGQAVEDAKNGEFDDDEDNNEGEEDMKHNVFDSDKENDEVLQHSEILASAIEDAKNMDL